MAPFRVRRSLVSVAAGLSLLAAACLSARADPAPRAIGFMGVLNTPAGPYQDGPAGITLSLYSAVAGGDALWSENQTVTVRNGAFSTMLGSVTPFPSGLDFSQPYFVGVKVGDDAEMTPRLPLAAVPYALFAYNVAHDAGLLARVSGGAMTSDGVNVGIGTAAPVGRLDIVGGSGFDGSGGAPEISFEYGGGGYRHFIRTRHNGNPGSGNAIDFFVNNSSDANGSSAPGVGNILNLTLDSGRVGIGTDSPTSPLTVAGVIESTSGGVKFPDGTTQTTAAGGSGWSLSGNAGVGSGFLGTTDADPLVLKVNGYPAMKYQYTETGFRAVNVLGAAGVNTIAGGVVGATIAGGGYDAFTGTDAPNSVQANFGAVGGGFSNWARSIGTTVAGGSKNEAGSLNAGAGNYAAVGGGVNNAARGGTSFVGGGNGNVAQGDNSTVTGGNSNFAYTSNATVAGGTANYSGFSNAGESQTVGGGNGNKAYQSFSTVAGGTANSAIGLRSTVAGGGSNTATADDTFVGGGSGNAAISHFSTIGGGDRNTAGLNTLLAGDGSTVGGGSQNVASGAYSTVSGGLLNTAAGQWAVIPGGKQNQTGADYAFAAGYMARAEHRGAFVWADSSGNTFTSTGVNQFLIQAGGGVGINTNDPSGFALNVAGTASVVSLTQTSDGRFKTDIAPLANALGTISDLQGVSFDWTRNGLWAGRFPDGRQIGFIAQDVEKVLPEVVSTDANGYKSVAYQNIVPVLVEAVKTLQSDTDRKLAAKDVEIEALRRQNTDLDQRLRRLEERIAPPSR